MSVLRLLIDWVMFIEHIFNISNDLY